MAFAVPIWLAVQDELLKRGEAEDGTRSCFDDFDDDNLFQILHLTRPCMEFITDAVGVRMKKEDLVLPVDSMVMVALNYYAHGVSSAAILQRFGLSQTECLTNIVGTVSGVIAGLSDQFISFPLTTKTRVKVAAKIERLCGIPGVLGVLAPVHFKTRVSPYEKDAFRSFVNAQGYTSVVSQIICDNDGNILSAEKCCVGSAYEQDMWDSSTKGREMEEELHGPFWVIGGKGYHLSKHVLTPVSEPANDNEVRFNEAHAKIHNVMQTTVGSMKRRFKCLMQLGFAQEGSLNKQSNIIKACCVLHNIAKKFSVPPPPAFGKIEPLPPAKQHSVPVEINPDALKARQELIDSHFSVRLNSQDSQGSNITKDDL
ncbi:putative nuclease HARBI1 [Mugil cephalus]|uniref:putative nuclease HARBI1 n=1 Tax=Mugil cephalus TaxID=48193 RepID=UPI001FB71BC9|nr:putative nuclease HARBI1 [Mugil cephalus]